MKFSKKNNYENRLANDTIFEKEDVTDDSKKEYNFVGTLNNWTTLEEQEKKVDEIDKVTNNNELEIKALENIKNKEFGAKKL